MKICAVIVSLGLWRYFLPWLKLIGLIAYSITLLLSCFAIKAQLITTKYTIIKTLIQLFMNLWKSWHWSFLQSCSISQSGKVYLQRCNSSNSSSSTTENNNNNNNNRATATKFQDLNFPPSSRQATTLNLLDDDALDLKLVSLSSSSPPSYQSVCTLDKVKSALERAEKETVRKRSSVSMSKSSSMPSNSSSSIKDGDFDQEERSPSASFAAGCPTCLLYVLISSNNPKCPRCNCNVPLPVAAKKPRIDLNISI